MAKVPVGAAERITTLRGRLGINQTELARLLGVSNVTVNRWEHGHTTPAAGAWARLLAAEEHGLPGLAAPAAPSPATSAEHHLPVPSTSFLGRRRELAELAQLLRRHRLVTIVGPGGIGKTRLALALAGASGLGPGGRFFADLAAATADAAVPAALADALRLPPDDVAPPLRRILDRWGISTGVVVLDNCEHVLAGAGSATAELMEGWPGLRIVATSRAPLGIPSEVVWEAPPLATSASDGERIDHGASEAVQLFATRATERQPSWAPRPVEVATIEELCRRLDGLPLAIELAAARMSMITPAELLDRLDRRLVLLSSPDESGPTRHRALDATIAWSHDLLTEPDQRVFRRLGIFPATFDLADAERASRDEALPTLERLVRQSLVVLVPGVGDGLPARYRLLDSIRLFARGRLRAAGEERATLETLADQLTAAVRGGGAEPTGEHVAASHQRTTWRVDNVQAVLIGLLEAGDKTRALGLAAVADRAWSRVGRSQEGLAYLERAMALPGETPPRLGIQAGISASWLHLRVGDTSKASAYARAATALAREQGDPPDFAAALDAAGRVELARSRFAAARALFEESLAAWRRVEVDTGGDEAVSGTISTLLDLGHACKWLAAFDDGIAAYEEARRLAAGAGDRAREGSILNNVGDLLGLAGRPREAVVYMEAAITIARELDQRDLIPPRLANLAELHIMLGEPTAAIRLGEEAMATLADVDDRDDAADIRYVLAAAYHAAHDDDAALRRFREALASYDRVGNASSIAMTIEAMGACLARAGSAGTAARWLGFGAAARGRLGVDAYPVPELPPAVARCRRRLSEEAFARAWEAGAAASADAVVMEALHLASVLAPSSGAGPRGDSSGLTARQRQVLRLVAEGRTNGEIAGALGISDRTVERHLAMIFAATGTDRRAAAVAYAMTNGWLDGGARSQERGAR